jgi:hypothetical protein
MLPKMITEFQKNSQSSDNASEGLLRIFLIQMRKKTIPTYKIKVGIKHFH